jgi:heme exporter protein B
MNGFCWFFNEALKMRWRNRSSIAQPLFFFVLLASLFPLSLPASQGALLVAMAPAVIWITAVLSILLGLDTLFAADYRDGSLEQMLLSQQPLSLMILGKVLAHWCCSGLPICLLSPLLAYAMGLTASQITALLLALLPGTLTVCLIGAMGAALTLSARHGGALIALLVLPLYIPVLIFGAGLVPDAVSLTAVLGPVYMLVALLVLALTFVPIVISLAFRHILD